MITVLYSHVFLPTFPRVLARIVDTNKDSKDRLLRSNIGSFHAVYWDYETSQNGDVQSEFGLYFM